MKILLVVLMFVGIVTQCNSSEYCVMDDESESFLTEIVDNLKEALGFEGDIKVYISSDPTLNAAATLSGDVIVHAGAVLQCKNVNELIAILAHEVGHIEGVHIATYIAQQSEFLRAGLVTTLIGAIASVCSQNGAPLLAGILGGQSIGTGMALSKLRQKENIADTKAVQAVKKLGWYPVINGFVSIHEKLAASSGMFNKYLSTHPESQERISKFKQYQEEFGKNKVSDKVKELLELYEKRFKTIQHKLRVLTASQELLPSLYTKPATGDEKYARAIVFYRMNKYQEAIKLLDPENPYHTEIKAMCLINLKKCGEAAKVAYSVLEKDRGTTLHRDLGIIFADAVYEGELKQYYDAAITILQKNSVKFSDDLSINNMLGKLYTLKGENATASLYAAQSSMLIGDIATAKLHATKATKSTNPIVKRKAEDMLSSLEE